MKPNDTTSFLSVSVSVYFALDFCPFPSVLLLASASLLLLSCSFSVGSCRRSFWVSLQLQFPTEEGLLWLISGLPAVAVPHNGRAFVANF